MPDDLLRWLRGAKLRAQKSVREAAAPLDDRMLHDRGEGLGLHVGPDLHRLGLVEVEDAALQGALRREFKWPGRSAGRQAGEGPNMPKGDPSPPRLGRPPAFRTG